ncbi:MAG: substrate-binding domain-containing protein [Terriglobia bacterium]
MAVGVLKALADLGLNCPRDIALATFDDLPLTEILKPNLAAIARPASAIGHKGVELLIQKIEAHATPNGPQKSRFSTELKTRKRTLGYEFNSSLRRKTKQGSHGRAVPTNNPRS